MKKIRFKLLGLLLCLALLVGMVPAYAATEDPLYVTREQAVSGIIHAVGLKTLNETPNDLSTFADADQVTQEYRDELGIAVSNGILSGASGKVLKPRLVMTRLEFAIVVSRSLRELPDLRACPAFSDVPAKVSGDVARIVKAGLMSGYGNGLFGSDDYLTQDQMIAVLNKIIGLTAARRQDDYYYAANQQWLSSIKLPAGYAGLMAFDEVSLSNTDKLKAITRELYNKKGTYAEGTMEQKMADFYSCILDMESRNKQGIEPIKGYLDSIDGAKTAQELLDVMAKMEKETGLNPLFSFGPSADLMDSTRYSLYGSGLSTVLPKDYMLMDNPQINAMYQGFLTQMFMLSGLSPEAAQAEAKKVFDLEKVIAAATMANEQASRIENLYNPITADDMAKWFANVNLKSYMSALEYGSVAKIIITDVNLMKKTGELMTDANLDALKAYTRLKLILNTSSYLSKDLSDAVTAFNSAFIGVSSARSEEDNAFDLLQSIMGSYMGRMYVEKYFSAEAKKDVESIVADIIATYQKRIEKLDWMSAETKAQAIAKLKAIKVKIGYPDTWRDPLAGIAIRTYANGGSLLKNFLAITSVQNSAVKKLLDKPVDKSAWMMTPQTVNAYYNPSSNEIVFPAGILQPPFYDLKATREQNLGGIGTIIAHEITHAFDNNGAQFDQNGNMLNWWTESDFTAFQQKCQSVIDLYNGLEIGPNAVLNGNLTVSENVADIGAMACILEIARGMPNANYKQLFESNAAIWRFTATVQIYQYLATQDVHSPNKFRVNRVLQNFQEFYDTFGIVPGDRMYLDPEKRVTIW